MNYSLKINKTTNTHDGRKAIGEKLGSGELDITPVPLTGLPGVLLLKLDAGIGCEARVAVVPIIRSPSYHFSPSKLILVLVYFLVVGGFTLVSNLTMDTWGVFEVLRVMLGFAVVKLPPGWHKKLLFLSVSLTYLLYSNQLYSDFVNAKLTQDELALDTFEDLNSSGLRPMINKEFYPYVFENVSDPHLVSLRQKVVKIDVIDTCFRVIKGNLSFFCVTNRFSAEYKLDWVNDLPDLVSYKIAEPVFYCEQAAYLVGNASVYLEKFDEVFLRIKESGIHAWKVQRRKRIAVSETEVAQDVLAVSLWVVLGTGYGLSTVCFLIEVGFEFYRGLRKLRHWVLSLNVRTVEFL